MGKALRPGPVGPKHLDGIIIFAPSGGDAAIGTAGLVKFANDLVVPGTVPAASYS